MNSTIALKRYLKSTDNVTFSPSFNYLMEKVYHNPKQLEFLMALGKVLWYNSPIFRKLFSRPEINGLGLLLSRNHSKSHMYTHVLSIDSRLRFMIGDKFGKKRSRYLEFLSTPTGNALCIPCVNIRFGSSLNTGAGGDNYFPWDLHCNYMSLVNNSSSILFIENKRSFSDKKPLINLRSFDIEDIDRVFISQMCNMIKYVYEEDFSKSELT